MSGLVASRVMLAVAGISDDAANEAEPSGDTSPASMFAVEVRCQCQQRFFVPCASISQHVCLAAHNPWGALHSTACVLF